MEIKKKNRQKKKIKLINLYCLKNQRKIGADEAPNKEVALKQGFQKNAANQIDFGYNLNDESER